MKFNKLLYHDTDSILLENKLNDKDISNFQLGKLKLEHILREGIFIAPKTYAFKDYADKTIIKHSGIKKGVMKYEDFIKLSKGENLKIKTTKFSKDLKSGTVNIQESLLDLKGIKSKIEYKQSINVYKYYNT